MSVLVDTSAFLPMLARADADRPRALATFEELRATRTPLITTSFVMHEATALVQSRLGMRAVRELHASLAPLMELVWVDPPVYDRAVAAMLAASRRRVSLTDWTSFDVMRERGIDTAFGFDGDFESQGFRLIPGPA